jgi:D-alanyl-D-alanine carboxypeptidase (penicillin-binding protein 5/6)
MRRIGPAGRRLIGPMLAVVFLLAGVPQSRAQEIPHPFNVDAAAAVLMDAGTGQLVYAQNPDQRIEPASFVKVLTLFLVFDALDSGQVHLNDLIPISEKAWRTGGSKMFVRVDERVPLEELIKGIAVESGNDACVAVAEYLQGSEAAFVHKMNEKLAELGLTDTRFQTVNGLPAPDQYTTAADMARLSRAYIQAHPKALAYHRIKEYSYQKIHQYNRNHLLWEDPSVDGLKTGHTEESGFHLVATAKRGEQRFIAVVMDANKESIREREALKLLNYGFRNFVAVSPFQKGQVLVRARLWKGTEKEVGLAAGANGALTVALELKDLVTYTAKVPGRIMAPIRGGQVLGAAVISAKGQVLKTVPLVAERDVPEAGFFKRTMDSARLMLTASGRIKLVVIGAVVLCGVLGLIWLLFQLGARKSRS